LIQDLLRKIDDADVWLFSKGQIRF
jgi:hypothetical protein